ncbi:hypothetical protein [Flavobacterium psychrophilum]|uniref:Uncharacterized protein n=1 Tax=Flavobacterium psychrophilum TaxID=96345 RepID=A0A7U2NGQ2_FLAPS|nr:hypothetical protein [Flavobacterium psychrophilum]ELM3645124.1 hypothetical protein [Flavobacterium psychrophilum]MEB3380373.1 hypothetical protein [Flavobacterium psychrophilum]OAE90538.1 hypothetical protein SU65_12435 [Flavobacterium psychrophilum]OJH12865.1 hypothetical protein FPG87_12950 [Flavobacterium psychrophilum]OUD28004.1 hypothetical protein FPG92_05570 [Flavobacterium psychrophilum]
MNQENLLERLKELRKNDNLKDVGFQKELIEKLFPETTENLVLDLSNVTSAFYGLLLDNVGKEFGYDKINNISKTTFYNIGQIKAKQCFEKIENMPIDSRSFLIVLISAIYNASPEYNFNVIEFSKEKTIFELYGVDRYLRILNNLSISNHIEFPTLSSFMQGIKDYFKIDCKMNIDFEIINIENNETKHTYKFELING